MGIAIHPSLAGNLQIGPGGSSVDKLYLPPAGPSGGSSAKTTHCGPVDSCGPDCRGCSGSSWGFCMCCKVFPDDYECSRQPCKDMCGGPNDCVKKDSCGKCIQGSNAATVQLDLPTSGTGLSTPPGTFSQRVAVNASAPPGFAVGMVPVTCLETGVTLITDCGGVTFGQESGTRTYSMETGLYEFCTSPFSMLIFYAASASNAVPGAVGIVSNGPHSP